jgi:transitional endoplasmic reticulum ATPase
MNTPKWSQTLQERFENGIAHCFILHFNVRDYALPSASLSCLAYLKSVLPGKAGRIVATFSRDRGIEFATESMKQKALKILGLGAAAQGAGQNPALQALQSLNLAPQAGQAANDFPSSPVEALPLLGRLLASSEPVAVVIDRAELVSPDAPLSQMAEADRVVLATLLRWGSDPEIMAAANLVVLLAGNLSSLHSELRATSARYEGIEVPLPGQAERKAFIERFLAARPVRLARGLTVDMVANATAGLSLMNVEDVLLRAEGLGELTGALVWDRKRDIIRGEFGEVLEVFEPRLGFDDIGGLGRVKDFFTRSVIRPMQEGRRRRVPMGVLMTGPAGTGKSVMAEAVAFEAGINAVRLRIGGQIASKWQGEGEKNLRRALIAIEALAPTIVFIDEIDQAVKRGDGGSGSQQDNRIFQMLLEFMSDTKHRGEVVFLAAANRPDLMDAALRRPGRFDKKVPFLIPDYEERAAIFEVMGRRYLEGTFYASDQALAATDGWTGAEIEAAVVKAAELVEDEPGLNGFEAINEAVKRLSPSTADIQFMTMLAIRECNDRDLLPERYQEMLDDREQLEQVVEQAEKRDFERVRRAL